MEILLILVGALLIYLLGTFLYQRRLLKRLTQEEFIEGYRKAQLIDVREPNEYKAGHILGARNIPMSQLRQRYQEIRPDQPVYLYCQNTTRSGRAAQMLRKKGIKDLYTLKGGFRSWTGKVKFPKK
ncbi:rhodanese-like domain-containing protein [Bacillus carboniphilus]|uniref:Rhodanese-like domain-containing protein n=1 Tax=Bacillus carboniphilus TaxID=86663 RepID=A0ABY9K1V6_9BACI|nr:rhodanese-like domain-containing protein [Bacillus carboniphilus]WLR43906.1 rhodanese-like domain-containing protein [Bacillus carboniphilus]